SPGLREFRGERSDCDRRVLSGQCAPALKCRSSDSEALGAQAHRDALDGFELFHWHGLRRTPETFALRPRTLESRNGALLQPLPFELAQSCEDCELEPDAG